MIQTISINQFRDEFRRIGRQDQFTYEGLEALYNHLTDLEDSCDMSIELDVVSLCCEFTEYEDLEEVQANYTEIRFIEDLYDNTSVIEFNNGSIIIQDY